MKLSFAILVITCMQLSAKVYSQDERIDVSVKKFPLSRVLAQIEHKSPYKFVYSPNIFPASMLVDAQFKETKISVVLDEILRNTGFSFKVVDDNLIVIARTKQNQQLISVRGKVTDQNGQGMPGVTVMVKGTKQATITTSEGTYELVTEPNNKITFFSVGYKTKEIAINGRNILNVQLEQDITKLDETVIIGYGTTTKRFNTGQMTSVSAEQIAQQPVTNVIQALQGLVPGLSVVQNNGYASGRFDINIRGKKDFFGSSTTPSNPLVIVDGVPLPTSYGDINRVGLNQNNIFGANSGQNPFFGINPNDIQSIDVLKDADGTAIYGSRGGNGVILITTKKGKSSQSGLTINAYTGITARPKTIELLSTKQYMEMRREAFKNSGIPPSASNAPDLFNYDTTRNVNWQKVLGARSVSSDAEIGYQGGNALTNFRFNGAYHRDGIPVPSGMPNNYNSQRISGSLALNHSSADKRFTSNIILNYSNTNETTPSGSFYQYYLPPNGPDILDSNGKLNFSQWGSSFPYSFTTLFQKYNANTNNFSSNVVLNYNIIKGLNATASMGYSNTAMTQFGAYPGSTQYSGAPATASQAQYGNNTVKNWIIEPRLEYRRSIAKGEMEVTAGGTLTESTVNGSSLTGSGYVNENLLENQGAASSLFTTTNYSQYRFQGYFARINYNWNRKYVLNIAGRRDASSRFAAGDQWGNFGSLGAAWLFSEENFIKNTMPFISFGKLRASYGSTGSPTSNDYQYLSLYSTSSIYDNTTTLSQNQAYNPGFKWQINKKSAAGVELGLFKDRLFLTVDWYEERGGNQLVSYPFPGYIGLFPIIQNLPAVIENKGWEFTLQTNILKKKDFQWVMNINMGINKNKLLSFPGIALTSYNSQYVVGLPLNIKKVYHYTGVDAKTGLYTFEDKTGDGILNIDDQYNLDLTPKFSGGMTQNLTLKNWHLSMIFSYAKQKGTYSLTNGLAGDARNQPVTVLSRWQKAGDITNVRKFTTSSGADVFNYQQSDAQINDASYIRLQNVSLSYALKKQLLEKTHLKGMRIYINCQNLFTVSPFKGYDPTNPYLSNNNFPAPSIYTAGFQLNL
ncbi:SusC/RagA family TonB-linked outer membrane protein [Pedobacter sp. MC2016-24]|uniref:SusC/RagA family TonB-linked outer membrane protein n=1 Tax=Pedobacter sp. MC2016-24 TaxID=2780090 RepID=UPI00187E8C2D|nr:SusC/RagA family TonB-linked outer membrane protein [Pedobacter sp. MC2016-24]MBE9601535.1 SusC/RagA family TonB-linked outer membrane protein [Pedobacter sp. MC2016-24]